MSIEEAIVKHAEAMEKLAEALTLKAQADMRAAREALAAAPAEPKAETIAHEDLPTTGAEAADPAPAAVPAKEPVTAEVLRNLCIKLAADKGRDYVLGVFAEFGAQRLTDVAPEQYQALYDALTAEG